MIISNSRGFVFIHIHKCAGTSVELALEPLMKWNDILLSTGLFAGKLDSYYKGKYGIDKHSTAFKVQQMIGDELWNEYFTFSFVRNPFARVVSLYTYLNSVLEKASKRQNISSSVIREYSQSKNFPDKTPWCWPGIQALLTTDHFSDFIRSPFLSKAPGMKTQFSSLSDKSSGKLIVDFIGKVENLDDDWQRVSEKTGMKVKLGVKNSSNQGKHWTEYYTNSEDVKYLSEKYSLDFEHFGYDKSF